MNKKTKIITGTAIAGAGAILIPTLISSYGKTMDKRATMRDFSKIVNEVYGVHLTGINSLKHSRVSLFAKGQWILRHKTDLVVVQTSEGNKELNISLTDYFVERTGLSEFPLEIQESLHFLGMSYNEEERAFSYQDPNGGAVSDIFIGKALKAVTTVIQNSYAII
ncbi:hypothetical protein CVD28_00505 [Bacillus sp. M6-12]|uniref:hypothetical protein n=1 Tax=Bacillus sp. M6-12 TaxID=2054166 RepID=UPI000C759C3D|nr:hypothetical protein [Bacillus sp. M6-12]PLS18915.1 hypothetical protein CVD28_00505 [Bacillus sp. M6-12]